MLEVEQLRRQAQEAAAALLKNGLGLPDPAFEGRERVQKSGSQSLHDAAKEIAEQIFASSASKS